MRRAVITGVGCVSAAGAGASALSEALRDGAPLGSVEPVTTLRGRTRQLRVARIPPIDREAWIPARKLRRMGDVSQLWVISCLAARADAGLDASAGGHPPERRGTFLGTGYGCIDTTWDYLLGMYADGPGVANPFLFSESVANAPAGHSAIELDTRGASVTFTCADASAAAAVEMAARAIRDDRVDIAWCGGIELIAPPLLRVIGTLGAIDFAGEGAACLVLESEDRARQRGARIYAEVAAGAIGADQGAPAAGWGRDPKPLAAVMRRALERGGERGRPASARRVFLQACGAPDAEEAERAAVEAVLPRAESVCVARVTGSLAAAGGLAIAAAALDPRTGPDDAALVSASGWGGSIVSLLLRPVSDPGGAGG